jgi:hypothetical protein
MKSCFFKDFAEMCSGKFKMISGFWAARFSTGQVVAFFLF